MTNKIKNTGRAVATIFLFALLLTTQGAYAAGKGNKNVDNDTMAVLSCFGYGYDVKVLVNGIDIGVTGGKSEGKRLFSKTNEMSAQAPPERRKQIFLLEDGPNSIVIEYRKKSNEKNDYLNVTVEAEGYPVPLLLLHTRNKANGKFEGAFTIKAAAPADFKPVFETDGGQARSAFVQVISDNTTVTPVLNGKTTMSMGMPGTVVLEDIKPGKNELNVLYKGEPNTEVKFAVVTPEGMKQITKTLPDAKEHTEAFTFTAK